MRLKLGVAIALAVVACSTAGRIDGPVLTAPFASGGMDALIMGTLAFDAGSGCLFLERDGGRVPVVWPSGASWQASPPGVVLDDGRLIEVGMSVTGGGGYLPTNLIQQRAGSKVADAAAACAGSSGEIALFNSEGDITITADRE